MTDVNGFFDYIDSNFDVYEVSGGTQLKINGCCPFCGEDRADLRLYVNATTGSGICFHCNTAFNAIKFVMANEHCSFKKAEQIVKGDQAGWARTEFEAKPDPLLVWPPRIEIEDSAAGAYLDNRGIGPEIIKHFGVYFCEHPTIIDGRLFSTMDRVIVPIHDINGIAVSWIGRSIIGAIPKYLFPPAFKGAQTLFNAWGIPKHADYLVICEGVMDAFGWWRNGVKNVVATFGKKISAEQIEIIKHLAPKMLLIAWDADAMWQNYTFVEKYGHLFKILIVDMNGKDADEMSPQEMTIALRIAKSYRWEDKIRYALN